MIFFQALIYILSLYFLFGIFYGIWFIRKGAQRLDQKMIGANWKIRLLLFPAAMGLWPLLMKLKNRQQ